MFKLSIILFLTGKFGAFFASIPLPIFAAAYCVLFGIVGESSIYPFFVCIRNKWKFFWPSIYPAFHLVFNIGSILAIYIFVCTNCCFHIWKKLKLLIWLCYSIFLAAVGISFTQFLNKNSMRNMYIIGLSLFLAVSIPQYFNEYRASAGDGPARSNAGWVSHAMYKKNMGSPLRSPCL